MSHTARRCLADALGEVVLQRHGEFVVHVHLDRDQQEVAHAQDGDAFHQVALVTVRPARFNASASASARFALVTMPCRSRPRCTMVCAICGRTPLMMASGTHEADGGDGLEQMLRDEGIDGGNAGDIDDGDFGAGFHDALEQRFHHHLGALRIQRTDHRQGEHAIPQLHHGRGQLEQFFLLASDHFLTRFLEGADGIHAQGVDELGHGPELAAQLGRGRLRIASGGNSNSGRFSEKMKLAVVCESKPCKARAAGQAVEGRCGHPPHSLPATLALSPLFAPDSSRRRNSRVCASNSAWLIRESREAPLVSRLACQLASSWLSFLRVASDRLLAQCCHGHPLKGRMMRPSLGQWNSARHTVSFDIGFTSDPLFASPIISSPTPVKCRP